MRRYVGSVVLIILFVVVHCCAAFAEQKLSIGQYREEYFVGVSSFYTNKYTSVSVDGTCAVDDRIDTAWNTNSRTTGEWLQLAIMDGNQYKIAGFRIAAGYWKNAEVYRENPRPKTIDVYCNNQYVQTFHLNDEKNYQTCWFENPVVGSSIKLVIVDVYDGTLFDDCAITEIDLLGVQGRGLSESALPDWGRAVQMIAEKIEAGGSIKKGDKDKCVLGLQVLLKEGFAVLEGNVDGDFGGGTEKAVNMLAEYMRNSGIPDLEQMISGQVDAAYWRNMMKYIGTFE